MDDKKMDEKLALLNKSYDRMPKHLNIDALMQKIDEEEKAIGTPTAVQRKKRWGVWAVAAAALFTGGILVSPAILEQPESPQTMTADNRAITHSEVAMVTEFDVTEQEVQRAIEEMRASIQQTLALEDELFDTLPFIEAGDRTAQFYMTERLQYVLEEQGFTEMVERLESEYRTASQFIRERELYEGGEESLLASFLDRIPQLTAAYTKAYNNASTDERRNELILAAKEEGIYFTDGVASFNYDKFAEQYEHSINGFGVLQGFVMFAQFANTLYEADDLRYAPDELLPYFDDMTTALLNIDSASTLYDVYAGQYILAVLRLLQGTEQYPLNEETLTYFKNGAAGVFAPLATTILTEFSSTGTSATAAALTYDDIERIFESARLSATNRVIEESVWTPTEFSITSMNEKWQAIPDDFFTYDVVDTVLYYIYAQQHDVDEVIEAIEATDVTYVEGITLETISSIRFVTYSPTLVEAYVHGEESYDALYRFENHNGHWQRTK